jgi:hypothetical protein
MSKLIRRKKEIGAALILALQLTTLTVIGLMAPFASGPQQSANAPADAQMSAPQAETQPTQAPTATVTRDALRASAVFATKLYEPLASQIFNLATSRAESARQSAQQSVQRSEAPNAATLTTDQQDYQPFTYVYFTGTGFQPGETVNMIVVELDPIQQSFQPWDVVADANGNFQTSWYIYSADFRGATFQATATGQSSQLTASATFTDASFTYSPSPSQSLTASAGGPAVAFTQYVTSPGAGSSFTASLDWSPANQNGIPASWVSTTPTTLSFSGAANETKSWSVVFSVPSGTSSGTYSGIIKANASPTVGKGPGTLVTLTVTSCSTSVSWTQLSPTGSPAPDVNSQAFVSDGQGDLIMFGGCGPTGCNTSNSTFVLHNAFGVSGAPSWTQLSPTGGPPGARHGHILAYDNGLVSGGPTTLNELIVSGGCAGGCFPLASDMWSLSNANGTGGTPTWTNRGTAPNVSFDNGQFGAVDSFNHLLMIFGGQNGGGSGCSTSGSTYVVNTSTFSPAGGTQLTTSGGPPGERYFPHGGYSAGPFNRLIIPNGSSCSDNDLWVLTHANGTGGAATWSDVLVQGGVNQPPVGPFPSIYSPELNMVFLVEQNNTAQPPNLWQLKNANGLDSNGNAATPVWSITTTTGAPSSGSLGAIAYDNVSNRLVVQIFQTNATQYWIISGAFGVCPLPPCNPPSVTTNPSNQTVTYGAASVSFTAAATGSPAPTVQWQVSTNGGVNWSDIGGAMTTTYTISNPSVAISGNQYRAVFTDSCIPRTATSSAATLTVNPKALDVTANNQSKTYGTTFTFAGTEFTTGAGQLINGDSVTTVTLTSPGAAATATVAGSPYTITASTAVGTGLSNYTITYHTGTLTVNTKALDITANNRIKTYGTAVTFAGTEFSASGLVNSDTVTSVTLTSTGAPASAGVAGSPYTITPSAAVGTGLGNYTISYHVGQLTVTKANATFAVTPYNVAYDGASHTSWPAPIMLTYGASPARPTITTSPLRRLRMSSMPSTSPALLQQRTRSMTVITRRRC